MGHWHAHPEPDAPRRRLGDGVDVRVRLAVALAAIVAVVVCNRAAFGPLVFGVCAAATVALGVPLRSLTRRLAAPLALACLLGVLRTFGAGTTQWFSADLGGFGTWTATREGFAAGALVAGRVLGALGLLAALCHDMPAYELFAALRWARVPQAWVEVALLMYRYLHVFGEQTVGVVAAQKARLGYGGLGRSLASLGSLAGIVVMRSLDQAERSHEAMVARAYQGALPLPPLSPLSRGQAALGAGALAAVAAVFLAAERWLP